MASMPTVTIDVQPATIAKLDVKPGDTVVFEHPGKLRLEWQARIIDGIRQQFGPDVKVLLLQEGMRLAAVLSPSEAEATGEPQDAPDEPLVVDG